MSLAVLVCGSRDWKQAGMVDVTLAGLEAVHGRLTVIQGAARGADKMAGDWARLHDCEHLPFPAAWNEHHPHWCPGEWCQRKRYCVAAGPRRNQQMLDVLLELRQSGSTILVVAFKSGFDFTLKSGGTEDMVRRAKDAGAPVYVSSRI